MFSRKHLYWRLQGTFAAPQQLADAQKIFSLMMRREVAGGRFSLWIAIMAGLFAAAVVAAQLDSPVIAFLFWFACLSALVSGVVVFTGKEERECRAARKELAEIMEFDHAQFPYWKNIAMKLKAILETEGLYREGMLPPHVLDEKH